MESDGKPPLAAIIFRGINFLGGGFPGTTFFMFRGVKFRGETCSGVNTRHVNQSTRAV